MERDKQLAQVFHYDLYGKRDEKYDFLLNNNLQTVPWRELELTEPQYFFATKDFSQKEEYEKGFSVQELFPVNSVGIVTAKDAVFVNIGKRALLKNIRDNLDINPNENLIHTIDYRPFDKRYVYYDTKRIERARENVMQHFFKGENMGFITNRQIRTSHIAHSFITKCITDLHIMETANACPYIFPLYLYLETDKLFSGEPRKPNLNETINDNFSQCIGLRFIAEPVETRLIASENETRLIASENETRSIASLQNDAFAPIDILDYIYAVLHSPTYRERYKEFLKIDFPRVPYPENAEQFWKLVELGGQLRRLHLMENVEIQEGMADFPIAGTNEVEKLQYANNRLFINDTQYFDNVPPETWNLYIGGYQPAQKWLKDRKRRTLGYDDIVHYRKIIRVLHLTMDIQKQIDTINIM